MKNENAKTEMGTTTNTISGIIKNKTTIPNNDIFVDVIHPKNNDWYYPSFSEVKKLPENGVFVFANVKPGRVSFLRVYKKKYFKFCDKLKFILRHLFNNFKYLSLQRWETARYTLGFRPYCFDYEVYYIIPLLHYRTDINIEIYPENSQFYDPVWSPYVGEFVYDEAELIAMKVNGMKDAINKLLKEYQKSNKYPEFLDFTTYKKKYGYEVYWIGTKWMNKDDIVIMPLVG